MSSWNTVSFNFAPLKPLVPPLKAVLTVLHVVEAVLEALLDIIKVFALDITNPLKAIVALLLASIRAIINQVESSGFAILLIHPDFGAGDFYAMLQSSAGGYTAFQNKVVAKFYDESDIFRPNYPAGSSVAMVVFYIGVESPGPLFQQLFALLNLIHHPIVLSGLPAPVELTVKPALKSNSTTAQVQNVAQKFSDLFGPDVQTSLVLQWRMPNAPTGAPGLNFVNALSSFVNTFRVPNFLVERSTKPRGSEVLVPLATQTEGPMIQGLFEKYTFPVTDSNVSMREFNGDVFRHFEYKKIVTGTDLLEGVASGSYMYVDNDPNLQPGTNVYYRVRAFFGNIPQDFVSATDAADISGNTDFQKKEGNEVRIFFGQNVTLGAPCQAVRGFVPLPVGGSSDFNLYQDTYDAIRVGLLLNMELPPAASTDTPEEQTQKAGWGALALVGGQIGPIKAESPLSSDLVKNPLFSFTARRLANKIATNAYTKPDLLALLGAAWDAGVRGTVANVLGAASVLGTTYTETPSTTATPTVTWTTIGIIGGITSSTAAKVNTYLAQESTYTTQPVLSGPYPSGQFTIHNTPIYVLPSDRLALAKFIQLALASSTGMVSHLSWYSVTLQDLFPALIPFLNDIEQFIQALLNITISFALEIEAIIDGLLQKIQQLEAIVQSILDLINLLDINVSVSVLLTSGSGSASTLAQNLLSSQNKPAESPYGYHAGMVLAAGGPGPGFIAAIKALGFILGFG